VLLKHHETSLLSHRKDTCILAATSTMKLVRYLSLFAYLAIHVLANTEKTIFIAPPQRSISEQLAHLKLHALNPASSSLRAALPVAFPIAEANKQAQGVQSWYLLSNLNPGQRYEVRVCWAATQPTTFWIDTFDTTTLLDDKELLGQVNEFSQRQLQTVPPLGENHPSSVLLIRIISAADFYSTNASLMLNPPPVDVDIILDPFIGNIFPKSLVPTAAYIVILAIGSWLVSGAVWKYLSTGRFVEGNKAHAD